MTRISQLAANRAEEKLKAKIESLEAELARLRGVSKKAEEEVNTTKIALATSESLR